MTSVPTLAVATRNERLARCVKLRVAGCTCAWNTDNVFPTAGWRSRHASRQVRDASAMMHARIAS